MFSQYIRLACAHHLAVAQDLFVKENKFLAQHGLALKAVGANKTGEHDGWVFQITLSSNNMLCVDLPGERDDNGTPIQIWECNGHESQLWFFDEGSNKIAWAGNSNKCLDADDRKEGNTVTIHDCNDDVNDNGASQKFGYHDGSIFLRKHGKHPSLCLDVSGAANSGTPLKLQKCNGQDQQKFALQAGVTIRMFQDYHLCLDLPGGDTTNGNFLQLWTCNGMAHQYWVYDSSNSRIRSAADSSKCLDAGDLQNGNSLQIWDCNGNDRQSFGYDPGTALLFVSAPGTGPTLCVDSTGGGLEAGSAVGIWFCNYCWNQHFQFWGPSSSLALPGPTVSQHASGGDACPDVPGPAPPSASNVFPTDHCQYDTGVWPSFQSQQDLENDEYWSAYFTTIYGGIPDWGYPICPGAFQFLWRHAAQATGVVQFEPENCRTGDEPHHIGQELDEGTYYTGETPLEARDAFAYIYNSKLLGASVPANTYVEVSHTVFPGDSGAIWYYMAVGSGVWLNMGTTVVYNDHADAVKDLLGVPCHDGAQDGLDTPTECENDFPGLYDKARSLGYDTIQFTHHYDCTCGPEGPSSFRQNRLCNTEIIYLKDANGAAHGCTGALKGGWEASSDCNCREELKSSTNDAASVSYSNCGVH